MSDADFYEGDDENKGEESNRDFRKRMEAQLKDVRAALRKAEQERDELAAFKAEREVDSLFDELKVPKDIQALYKGEKDKQSISEWYEAFKAVAGITSEEAGAEATPEVKQLADTQAAGQVGQTPAGPSSLEGLRKQSAELQRRSGDLTEADLDDYLKRAGFPGGPEISIPQEL